MTNDVFPNATLLIPLILACLFMISAAHAEFVYPGRFPRLAAPNSASAAGTPAAPPKTPTPSLIDPGAVAALNACDVASLYSICPPFGADANGPFQDPMGLFRPTHHDLRQGRAQAVNQAIG
jgi:hypothetical protein